jgi:hypothetical protein
MFSIFENDDILKEIVSFLPFEDKIQFGKFCKKNFTKFYDFTNKNISGISDLFYEKYDDIYDYLQDFRFMYMNVINKEYIEYRKEAYFYQEYNDINEYHKQLLYETKLFHKRWNYDCDNESDTDSDTDSEITNISFSNYSFIYRDFDIMEEECKELLDETFHTIYARIFIELIENYDLPIPTSQELDEHFPVCVFDEVISYYQTCLKNDTDVYTFCQRCGRFGHHNTSKTCIFYSLQYEKIEIKKEVKYQINTIINTIQSKYEEEVKRKLREPFLCVMCKIYNKKKNCAFNCCGGCCKNDNCAPHKKPPKIDPLCVICKINNKKKSCAFNCCGGCCKNDNCKHKI